jgi:hypothetical protein
MAQLNLQGSVERWREVYRRIYGDTLDADQCGDLTNRVAWEHRDAGVRLIEKHEHQNHAVLAGFRFSVDALLLAEGGQLVGETDILGSAGDRHTGERGPATAQWHGWGPVHSPHPLLPIQPPPLPAEPGEPEPPGDAILPAEEFAQYAAAAARVTLEQKLVHPEWDTLTKEQQDALWPHILQRALSHGDRYRKARTIGNHTVRLNPTVMDLAIGVWLNPPLEQMDPLMDRAVEEQIKLVGAGQPVPPRQVPERLVVVDKRFVIQRTGVRFSWRGCTAFDLPVRIGRDRNPRFADWLAKKGFNVGRIVPASVHRNPRKLSEGIMWLPPTLEAMHVRGLWAEVTILVDTSAEGDNYDLDRDAMAAYVAEIGHVCGSHDNVAGIELVNENAHGGQHHVHLTTDVAFLRELRALCPAHIPVSWGSHGGELREIDGGEYVTIHSDRGRTPEENAITLAQHQVIAGKPVIDNETMGIAEQPRHQRLADPEFARRLIRAYRQRGIAGATLHLDAGLSCDTALLGPVQEAAASLFNAHDVTS